MPLYEYECLKCGRRTERIEKVSGPHLKKCPHCSGKVERMPASPAIQFKGSGWYVTDYAGKAKSGDSAKEGAKEATADAAKGADSKTEKESSATDKKSAKKK